MALLLFFSPPYYTPTFHSTATHIFNKKKNMQQKEETKQRILVGTSTFLLYSINVPWSSQELCLFSFFLFSLIYYFYIIVAFFCPRWVHNFLCPYKKFVVIFWANLHFGCSLFVFPFPEHLHILTHMYWNQQSA